jgi:hypothetical protein
MPVPVAPKHTSVAVTQSTACAGGALGAPGSRPSSAAAQRGELAGAPGQPASALGTDPHAAGGEGRASAPGGPAVEAELAALRTALAEKQREVATGRADLERRQALLRSAAGARSRPGDGIRGTWSGDCDTGHSKRTACRGVCRAVPARLLSKLTTQTLMSKQQPVRYNQQVDTCGGDGKLGRLEHASACAGSARREVLELRMQRAAAATALASADGRISGLVAELGALARKVRALEDGAAAAVGEASQVPPAALWHASSTHWPASCMRAQPFAA